jgi:hypothetical protein
MFGWAVTIAAGSTTQYVEDRSSVRNSGKRLKPTKSFGSWSIATAIFVRTGCRVDVVNIRVDLV